MANNDGREISAARKQLETLLKESDYMADVIGTHRKTTAVFLAAFLELLIENGSVQRDAVNDALDKLSRHFGRPSQGTAMSHSQLQV
jgi:hypothetical protein